MAALAVAAAVVIAVLLGGRIAELEDRSGRARERTTNQVAALEALAQDSGNAVRLVGTENAPGALGFLLMTSDERVAVLVCSGLQRMPSGKAYQLWLNKADGKVSGRLVNAGYCGFALLVVRSPEPISDLWHDHRAGGRKRGADGSQGNGRRHSVVGSRRST